MTSVGDLGEKRLIAEVVSSLAPRFEQGIGVGDDAAVVVPPANSDLVISTDRVPSDLIAVRFGLMGIRELGAYLAEVCISDVVAMAARPAGLLLNLAVPSEFLLSDFRAFLEGFIAAGLAHGAPLIGGDTTWAAEPSFSATALGFGPSGLRLRRNGASSGDILALSGPVGGFGAALSYFAARRAKRIQRLPSATEEHLLNSLIRPRARSDLVGRLLAEPRPTAAMDITDGLGQTLIELAAASGVGFQVDAQALPVEPSAREVAEATGVPIHEMVFGIGLELELLLTLPAWRRTATEIEGFVPIGKVVNADAGILLVESDGRAGPLPGRGWQHFGTDAENLIAGS